jgi:hypothetical protein
VGLEGSEELSLAAWQIRRSRLLYKNLCDDGCAWRHLLRSLHGQDLPDYASHGAGKGCQGKIGESYRRAHEPSLAIQQRLKAELPVAIGCRCGELVPIEIYKAALGIGKRRRPQPIIYSASKRHEPLVSITVSAAPITSAPAMRYYQREKEQKHRKIHCFAVSHRNLFLYVVVTCRYEKRDIE